MERLLYSTDVTSHDTAEFDILHGGISPAPDEPSPCMSCIGGTPPSIFPRIPRPIGEAPAKSFESGESRGRLMGESRTVRYLQGAIDLIQLPTKR